MRSHAASGISCGAGPDEETSVERPFGKHRSRSPEPAGFRLLYYEIRQAARGPTKQQPIGQVCVDMNREEGLPVLSVIIPTFNRSRSLARTLQSCAEQSWPGGRFEVVVVDDGSPDGAAYDFRDTYPFELHILRQENEGADKARNYGASAARGDILFFLDDDIAISPQCLGAAARIHHEFDKVIVVGSLQAVVHDPRSPFQEIYRWETSTPPPSEESGPQGEKISFADCLTGLFAVKRRHFAALGGLRSVVGDGRAAWGGVEFGCRAHRYGFHFRRCRAAVGWHDDFSIQNLDTYARRWETASAAAVVLFQQYPEALPAMPMFQDKTPPSSSDPANLLLRKWVRRTASSKCPLWMMERIAGLLEERYPSRTLLRPLYRWIVGGHICRGFRQGLREYGPVSRSQSLGPDQK
jgi:GT2 family glycosyltransferase